MHSRDCSFILIVRDFYGGSPDMPPTKAAHQATNEKCPDPTVDQLKTTFAFFECFTRDTEDMTPRQDGADKIFASQAVVRALSPNPIPTMPCVRVHSLLS